MAQALPRARRAANCVRQAASAANRAHSALHLPRTARSSLVRPIARWPTASHPSLRLATVLLAEDRHAVVQQAWLAPLSATAERASVSRQLGQMASPLDLRLSHPESAARTKVQAVDVVMTLMEVTLIFMRMHWRDKNSFLVNIHMFHTKL